MLFYRSVASELFILMATPGIIFLIFFEIYRQATAKNKQEILSILQRFNLCYRR